MISSYYFSVSGIHCSSCLRKIKSLSFETPMLEDVNIDMERKTVTVQGRSGFDAINFVKSIESLGFSAKELQKETHDSVEKNDQQKELLIRVGVAGALTGNIMLLSYATYLGAPEKFSHLFSWASFGLFLPIIYFCADLIFKNSWRAIKVRKASIDTPLAIALFFGGLLSLVNLLQKSSEVYFDSLAALVFLTLTSRYIVQRVQSRYIRPLSIHDLFSNQKYIKLDGEKEVSISRVEIEKNDKLRLTFQDIIPADGVLLIEKAEVDNSLITGESEPVCLNKYDQVFAGTKCVSNDFLMEVSCDLNDSRVNQLLQKVNKALKRDGRIVSFTDKVAQVFTLSVLLIGVLFLASYSFIDSHSAINRVLALLVIACPCALAVTSPLALSLGIRKALNLGLMVKSADVFEKISRSKNLIFDKTGTLTRHGALGIDWSPQMPSDEQREIIYSLEKRSQHPIARAILRSLGETGIAELPVEGFQEIIGKGVLGEVEGSEYSLFREPSEDGSSKIGFFENNQLLLTANLRTDVDSETLSEIDHYIQGGFNLFVLTGDNRLNGERLSDVSLLEADQVFSEVSPEWKARFVENLENKEETIYIGDGMNDSLAMAHAGLGISMCESVEATFSSSDVHLLNQGVRGVSVLFKLSKKVMSTIKALLGISLVYNFIFGALALLGMIGPLMAAVLMPLSSLSLLGICVWSLGGKNE